MIKEVNIQQNNQRGFPLDIPSIQSIDSMVFKTPITILVGDKIFLDKVKRYLVRLSEGLSVILKLKITITTFNFQGIYSTCFLF